MYVRCRLDRSRNVGKAKAVCIKRIERLYFTITFEELKEENTIMTITEFKQYEQTRPKIGTKAKPGKGWKGTTSEKELE